MFRFLGEIFLLVSIGTAVGQTAWGKKYGQLILDGAMWVFKWAKEATTGDATAN